MSTAKARARYLVSTLTPPAKVAALLTPAAVVVEQEPAEVAGLPGGQDLREPAARSAQDAAPMSADMLELVEPAGFWPDDELEPGAAPVSAAAARHTSNILPSAGAPADLGQVRHELDESQAQACAPRRRRITGQYSADEVRALAGELVSIETTLTPGRFLCTWLESEPGAADEPRRLDGSKNGGAL